VEKYNRAIQATDDNIIQRMNITCPITKVADTHSEYVRLIVFHGKNVYSKALQYYVYTHTARLVHISDYDARFIASGCFVSYYVFSLYCLTPFLPGTSPETTVIPNGQVSSFRLQDFPYYV